MNPLAEEFWDHFASTSALPVMTIPRLLTFTLALAACATDPTASTTTPADDQTTGKADSYVHHGPTTVVNHCMFQYYNSETPDQVVLDQMTTTATDSYPNFLQPIGAADLPYSGSVLASAKWVGTQPSTTDGWYGLVIKDVTGTALFISSEAAVTISGVASAGFVEAGDLRANVTTFSYHGGSYNRLELLCYLTPG
jgi:hypothetical protein